jgi:hypothetical protein
MTELVNDVDYTSLAGLRGTTVTLCDITIYHCQFCGPSTADYIEIPGMAELHRCLAAAKALHAKHLWFRRTGDAWAVVLRTTEPTEKRRTAKKKVLR